MLKMIHICSEVHEISILICNCVARFSYAKQLQSEKYLLCDASQSPALKVFQQLMLQPFELPNLILSTGTEQFNLGMKQCYRNQAKERNNISLTPGLILQVTKVQGQIFDLKLKVYHQLMITFNVSKTANFSTLVRFSKMAALHPPHKLFLALNYQLWITESHYQFLHHHLVQHLFPRMDLYCSSLKNTVQNSNIGNFEQPKVPVLVGNFWITCLKWSILVTLGCHEVTNLVTLVIICMH